MTQEQRKSVETMIESLLESLEDTLINTEWIENKTKKTISSKLQNLSYIIGGPEEMYYTKQFDHYNGFGNVIKKHLIPFVNNILFV